MTKLITVVMLQASACASLLGLYVSLLPVTAERPWWHWFLITFAVLASCCLAITEIVGYLRSAPKTYLSQRKINRYMQRWVSSGGRVVIFSRDMSWAQEGETRAVLLGKARRNELTVCVEHSMPLTDALRDAGATIINYGHLRHIPRSRFTIVDFEKEGARVAVGAKFKGRHVIQEFQNGEHPFFGVAEDLVKILIENNRQSADE